MRTRRKTQTPGPRPVAKPVKKPLPIEIPPISPPINAQITLYEHDNYAGANYLITEAGVENLSPLGFNDRASSADVVGRWEVWTDAHYSGKRVVLEQGRYPSLRAFGINDAISSARQVVEPQTRLATLAKKEFGFFYADAAQFAQTAGWVTYTHIAHGPADYGPMFIDMAIAAGHTRLVITAGFCGFVKFGNGLVYRGKLDSRNALRAWLALLQDKDQLRYVIGVYTWDEPNLPEGRISDADLKSFCADVRAVCAEFDIYPGLWTIYAGGNDDRPALGDHDVIGIDDYGRGIGVLEAYRRLGLTRGQSSVLVPQTMNMDNRGPQWPDAWVQAAMDDDRCLGIMAFDQMGLRECAADVQQAWAGAGREFVEARKSFVKGAA